VTRVEPIRLRRETPLAALLGVCVAAIALWQALWLFRTHTLGAWDWTAQASSLTRLDPAPHIANTEILDPVRQMVPWALAAREQLAQGHAPLWSPYNGGSPLLANYQSALLSPFTWPFFAAPLGLALVLSAALKLFALTAGMFLLLRELSFSRIAAATSAVAFGTAGFHLMCVLHPHVGVLACLPPALIAVERAARRRRETPDALPLAALAALSLCLGVMTLAGHPETLLFCLYVVAAFASLRVLQLARGEHGVAAAARFGAALVVAGLLGAGVGAVQVAPFLELFSASQLAHDAGRSIARFSPYHFLLLFLPDAVGHPSTGPTAGPLLAANYQEVNSMHIGSLVAALALASPVVLRRNATGWFFFALGVAALISVYDVPGLNSINDALFFSSYMPSTRVNPLWMVGASVCAACVVDSALRGREAGARTIIVSALAGGLLIAARLAAPLWWSSAGEGAADAIREATEIGAPRSTTLLVLALAGLAALSLLGPARKRWARFAVVSVLLGSVAAQGVYVFGDFMPVVEDRCVLPRNERLNAFVERTAGERVVFLTSDRLPVNTNALYGVRLLSSYEMLKERRWSLLREELLGVTSHLSGTHYASRRALDLFGVRAVVTRGEWLPLDTENCSGQLETQSRWVLMSEFGFPAKPRLAKLDSGRPSLTQRIRPSRDGLAAIALVFRDAPHALDAALELRLEDPDTAVVLATRALRLGELRALPNQRRECVFSFDPIANSTDRELELTVALVDAKRANGVELLRAGKLSSAVSAESEDDADDKPRKGSARVVFDLAYAFKDFGPPTACGELLVRQYEAGVGEAWLVSRAVEARSEEDAHALVLSEEFDPKQEVVLEGRPTSGERNRERELIVESRFGAAQRFRTQSAAPCYLVLAQPFVPGWRARVDGKRVEVLRANYAFCAVAAPAGEHLIEFEYAPASIRWGALASLSSLLIVTLGGAAAARRARAVRTLASTP